MRKLIKRKRKIKVNMCECGSIYAPVYYSLEKKKFVCKLCVGYPDDRS